jgi:hypothetical protein
MSAAIDPGHAIRAVLEAVTVDGFPRLSFTVAEVEAMTGIPRRTLYREIEAGRIDCKRVGTRCYPTVTGLARYFEDEEHAPT